MVKIVPSVLAETPPEYVHDLTVAVGLSDRIQIDMVDGKFADNKTVNLAQIYWPENVLADIHIMYHHPEEQVSTLIALNPHLVLAHAEAEGMDMDTANKMASELQAVDIRFGLALLPETPVAAIEACIKNLDHVLVFTGELGHYGGVLAKDCLVKIDQARRFNPGLEIGVDGGITDTTVAAVTAAGADVLNVGGYIQTAEDPKTAYDKLKTLAVKAPATKKRLI